MPVLFSCGASTHRCQPSPVAWWTAEPRLFGPRGESCLPRPVIWEPPVNDRPSVDELEHLYASLTQDERDELLQELLVAAAHGEEAMMEVIDAWMVDRAGRELIDDLGALRGED